jgi:large subunit ribosomal protein L3e
MSHRKYECPRHGSLAFLPRKRTRKHRGHLRAFQQDDPAAEVHLTAFIGFKAGMTHVLRDVDRPGSKIHKKEAVEAVTIIECPPVTVVGVVGYEQTITGLRTTKTVFAAHLSDQFKRRLYKNWYKTQHKAFSQYHKAFEGKGSSKAFEDGLEEIAKKCQVRFAAGGRGGTRRAHAARAQDARSSLLAREAREARSRVARTLIAETALVPSGALSV